MKRREMLKWAAGAAAVLTAGPRLAWAGATSETAAAPTAAAMPKRPYGKSGVELSIVGFGGLVLSRLDQDAANKLVAEAFEKGVNYFDVAPEYGSAEEKMGPALAPYRKKVFLACKIAQRTAEAAKKEFERSLERLKTDHFDLYQLHHIRKVGEDVDAVFAKGGAWEFIQEARKDGRIRHVGFSAHTEEAAVAALDKFEFNSVMFPLTFAMWFGANWGQTTFEKAKAKGAAVLAIKSLIRGRWPTGPREPGPFARMWCQPLTDPDEQAKSVRWTLSQGATAILPPAHDVLHRRAFEIGLGFAPIAAAETEQLKKLAATLDPLFKHGQEP
ncbi:MAG: aldo/keto reductase [Planctomycetes bacterium]|nr:aldo/keto reductase [Planctomycetota bacterium]